MTDHHHSHDEGERKIRKTILNTINRDRDASVIDHENLNDRGHSHSHDHGKNHNIVRASNLIENPDNMTNLSQNLIGKKDDSDEDEDEEAFKNVTRTANKIAKKMSFVQNIKKSIAIDRKYIY